MDREELARELIAQNGSAALRIVQGLIEHATRTGDHWAAEVWRNVEASIRKELSGVGAMPP
jgi:hypothetical protein